jgi:hypothetical protein
MRGQERHDYQPINIDYTFSDFRRTGQPNHAILVQFANIAGIETADLDRLFKGEGFDRLVMAGRRMEEWYFQYSIRCSLGAKHGERFAADEVANDLLDGHAASRVT